VPVVSSIAPDLFEIAISSTPRQRDWMFSRRYRRAARELLASAASVVSNMPSIEIEL